MTTLRVVTADEDDIFPPLTHPGSPVPALGKRLPDFISVSPSGPTYRLKQGTTYAQVMFLGGDGPLTTWAQIQPDLIAHHQRYSPPADFVPPS